MPVDFQRYLLAKRSVDDRALNRIVWQHLAALLPPNSNVIEIACGIGTMRARMHAWGLLTTAARYRGVDSDPENIRAACSGDFPGKPVFECADLFALEAESDHDLLVAAAFLDLVDLDEALPQLLAFIRPGGLAYFPIHFDGLTLFEPSHPGDDRILAAYHHSMDARLSGGHSRTGRRLFTALPAAGYEILAAGGSDWVVHPGPEGVYPGDEAYFLESILQFFETSCAGVEGLEDWLATRQAQVNGGRLVFIAHQFDFLARKPG